MLCNHCQADIDWHPVLSVLVMRRMIVVDQEDVMLETCCKGYAYEVDIHIHLLSGVGNERN